MGTGCFLTPPEKPTPTAHVCQGLSGLSAHLPKKKTPKAEFLGKDLTDNYAKTILKDIIYSFQMQLRMFKTM